MARYAFYHTSEWKKLRQAVLDRDGGMCVVCGQRASVVHHVVPVDDSNITDPYVVWSMDNLVSVCPLCHGAIHAKLSGASATADGWIFDDEGNLIFVGDKFEKLSKNKNGK